jgi:tetratricopeptide (TPR) repeat protein
VAENANPAIENAVPGPLAEPPEWAKELFTPERIEKWLRGEITLQELNAIAGAEMVAMAVIGFSLYEQGRYEEAEVVFRGLCALDPSEAYYETVLGAVFLAREDLDSAEACFNRAIQLDEKDIAPYVNRGELYLRKGRVIEAAYDFKSAVDLDPDRQNPLSQRARLLAAAALEAIERATKLAEVNAAAAGSKGDVRN